MSSLKSNTTKRTRSSNSVSLKQGTLAFPTAKRTGSSTSSTPKAKKPATRTKSAPVPVEVEDIDSSSSSSGVEDRIERLSSEEYVDAPAVVSSKQQQKKSSKVVDKGKAPLRGRENAIDLRAANLGKWRKHYGEVKEKMGNLEPIHAEEQNKANHILRVFDDSYEYGPCVGVTRLERWERAQALGLHPPVEVQEILLTKQGIEEDEFKHSVFYGVV